MSQDTPEMPRLNWRPSHEGAEESGKQPPPRTPPTDKARGHHDFGRSAFFVEVVLIDFKDFVGLLDPCANSMAQHQVDQLFTIHKDDLGR